MKMGQKKLGFALLVSSTALGAVACGGGSAGPASGFTSASQLNSAMEAPTGSVEPATAVGVAQAFENSNSSGLAGVRQKLQAQSASVACSGGGSISVSGNETSSNFSYNNCMEAGCTINGSGSVFVSGTDVNSACFSYNVSETCVDPPIDIDLSFSGCLDSEFGFVYLVEYEGETYTVTGSYYDGTGTLEITGENGSFSCTYTADAGSCTSSSGETFSFTADSASADDTAADR
jgi:hypothetical protein